MEYTAEVEECDKARGSVLKPKGRGSKSTNRADERDTLAPLAYCMGRTLPVSQQHERTSVSEYLRKDQAFSFLAGDFNIILLGP